MIWLAFWTGCSVGMLLGMFIITLFMGADDNG
jgi:hypothetical protein